MKLGLFYEVQTPKPLDSDDWPPGYEALKFREALDQIELADKVGFDYIWVAEHHFTGEYTHTSAPDLLLAAAAQRTKRIRLGPGVIQMVPGHNHPARVAERMSTVDILCDGRLEFGTGRGNPNELGFFVDDLSDTKEQWRECTRECLKMMSMSPYPGYDGKYVHMAMTNVVPKPVQKPHPPIWVASVHEETAIEAAQSGMGALILSMAGPETVGQWVKAYWNAYRAGVEPIGQALNLGVFATVNGICAKTDEEAERREKAGFAFFNYSIHRAISSTRNPPAHINREFVEKQRQEAATALAERPDPRDSNAPVMRQLLVGSPETYRQRLRQYEAAHIDEVTIMIQAGDRRHDDIMEAIELIGTEVAPEFHERHETTHREWRRQQIGDAKFPVVCSV